MGDLMILLKCDDPSLEIANKKQIQEGLFYWVSEYRQSDSFDYHSSHLIKAVKVVDGVLLFHDEISASKVVGISYPEEIKMTHSNVTSTHFQKDNWHMKKAVSVTTALEAQESSF